MKQANKQRIREEDKAKSMTQENGKKQIKSNE